ncbi:uncharacterized protein LOC141855105 [Brevipalpus obovatus]|uniref:uncharacterized protein LOC141855105 n=1 Tax=Brevipalpus obovatus TaxID=246614 RepID=UPI003D9E9FD7
MSWGTELWDQYDNINYHTQKGIEFLDKFGSFVKERCAIENEYASKLRRLVKNHQLKKKDDDYPQYTYVKAFMMMLDEISDLAGQHEVIAETMMQAIVKQVGQIAKDMKEERKRILTDGAKNQQILQGSLLQLDKAKKAYDKAFKEAEKAHENFIRVDADYNLSRAEVEKAKTCSTQKNQLCEESKSEYAKHLQSTNNTQRQHYTELMPMVFKRFQTMEERRITYIKDYVKESALIQRNVAPIIDRCLEGVLQASESIDAQKDCYLVVERYKTGNEPPDDLPFEDLNSPRPVNDHQNESRSSLHYSDSISRKSHSHKGTFIGPRLRKRSYLKNIFGSNKASNDDGKTEDLDNLPPNQRRKRIQGEIDKLRAQILQETNVREGLIKMKHVFEENNSFGDPMTVQNDLKKSSEKLEELQHRLRQAESLLDCNGTNNDHPHDNDHPHENYDHSPNNLRKPQNNSLSEDSLSRSASDSSVSQKHDPSTPLHGVDEAPLNNHDNDNHNDNYEPIDSIHAVEFIDDEPDGGEIDSEPLPPLGKAWALFAFEANSEGAIPMEENEMFEVVELDQGDGWTRVRRLTDREEGFVPTSWLKLDLSSNPGNVQPADGRTAPSQANQASSFWTILRDVVVRCVIMYFIFSFFNKPQQPRTPSPSSPSGATPTAAQPATNLFENGMMMDFYVFVSENENKPDFRKSEELVWTKKNIVFGEWKGGPNNDGIYELNTTVSISERVQNNGTLFMHVFLVKSGGDPNPEASEHSSRRYTVHKKTQLNKFKKRRYLSTHNLLTGKTSMSKESLEKLEQNIKEEIVSHWHPNTTINVIYDQTPWIEGRVPVPFDQYIKFVDDPILGKYYPVIYLNDYWNLQRDYYPINSTLKELPLFLTFQPLSMFKWQLYVTQTMRSQWNNYLGGELMEESDASQDSIKEALLETSPILLALTCVVSISHMIFEFLAFKNDIQFWRNRKSLEGLSVRSVFFNVFQSVVVFLYVLDNDTNTLVRFSLGIGLLIEVWKINKVTNIEIDRTNKIFGIIPKIHIKDKGSYVNSSTREFDEMAFKYLSWACFPLLIGYAIYSLLYQEHKGWYSWVLGMVYGFLLTFGFISMTPQLFINYKLKSVAHLPWRMLTYKFLNTFIDDIFAFVIKMPTMYRIGCFRDDIIFIVYLYQKFKYRTDLKRVNEFGVSGEDLANTSQTENEAIEQAPDGPTPVESKKDQ